MTISPVDVGVASWITPAHLQTLQAHGITLGKLAKDIAAFEIFDAYIEAVEQRLAGHAVTPSCRAPLSIYGASNVGKSNLELLVQDCLAAADYNAIG